MMMPVRLTTPMKAVRPKGLPVTHLEAQGRLRLLGRAQRASEAEIEVNPRARSAVMRVAEVLA